MKILRQSAAVQGGSLNRTPAALRENWGESGVKVASLKKVMDHDNHEMRAKFKEFLKQDCFKPKYAITLEEEREEALKKLQMGTVQICYFFIEEIDNSRTFTVTTFFFHK